MEENKISIIIPIYNTEKYLDRCLNSVVNQTYENLEIICIDDGSTDSSGEILDRFAKNDNRIIAIHKKNEGVVEARNTGLAIMSGDFVGFVDSDDYIDRNMYSVLAQEMVDIDVDIVTCNYYFDINGAINAASNKHEVPSNVMEAKDFLRYMYERDTYQGVASYLWTRLFRKRLFDNRWFTKNFEGFDDIVLVAEIMMRTRNVKYVDKPLYYYYQREDSIVHDFASQLKSFNWIKAYERIIEIYEKNDINSDVMDIIKRMYVYRCGRTLECAKLLGVHEKDIQLKDSINKYLEVYEMSNQKNPNRIQWIRQLIME